MNVLVAEDENSIAYMYRVVLEHRNHEATITKDGQTCLETYLGTPNMKSRPSYDIVVLDYRMPRLDGIGVARRVLEANK
jgi:CheY-like chemotaxis protein